MLKLLWMERRKMRRSNIVWIAIFATIMIAVIVLLGGRAEYQGSDSRFWSLRQIDTAGWYMSAVQSWATFFALPAVIALLGSYMVCREEQEDTLKSLLIIPINRAKLNAAKMIITFAFSILFYFLLFIISFLVEFILHGSELSIKMVLVFLKEYLLDGIGIFLAIMPIIALISRMKNGYWIALVFTEIYSFAGLFAGMSNVLKTFYPITAVFNFSGHYNASAGSMTGSLIVLLLCGCLSVFILKE
jgi:ABC-type transport system involved in multi-copper enzyme maturation permease subunit